VFDSKHSKSVLPASACLAVWLGLHAHGDKDNSCGARPLNGTTATEEQLVTTIASNPCQCHAPFYHDMHCNQICAPDEPQPQTPLQQCTEDGQP